MTNQITSSNAKVAECVSNLSTIVGHLSLKVSNIEGHLDSNEDRRCEELCDTMAGNHKNQSLQKMRISSYGTASNENADVFDDEKKKDTDDEDFEFI